MAKLSTKEAADRMGVSPSTLRYWRMIHVGPPFFRYSPQNYRYDERDVEAYVNERRYDPSARAELEGVYAHR